MCSIFISWHGLPKATHGLHGYLNKHARLVEDCLGASRLQAGRPDNKISGQAEKPTKKKISELAFFFVGSLFGF
jgi:hypothetical protein